MLPPDLVPYRPWYDKDHVNRHAGIIALKENIVAVREEIRELQREAPESYDDGWNIHGFIRFGNRYEKAIKNCPVTWKCLQLFGVDHSFGEVFVSSLRPYKFLSIHTGESGFGLISHFALEIPKGDLQMVVGEEGRVWTQDEAILFNDAFPHYAYNNTASPRSVLLIEHWNPAVPEGVRPMLSAFFTLYDQYVPDEVYQLNGMAENGFELNSGKDSMMRTFMRMRNEMGGN
jgi:aspartyl/asparaginyl beta-hydroxylase (cupin superfamily)